MQREVLKLIGQAVADAVASEIQHSKKVERREAEDAERAREATPADPDDGW